MEAKRGTTKLRVHMCAPVDESAHDLDVEIEVFGSQEMALRAVVDALPSHVWYRWLDLNTGDNGRNQDVFPSAEEDWDEEVNSRGWKHEVDPFGLPFERHYGPEPLYKNDEDANKRSVGRVSRIDT